MKSNNQPWHSISSTEIIVQLKSNFEQGLTGEEVSLRQEQFGKNVLPKKDNPPFWKIFISQFKNALIYVLLISVIISFFLGEYSDAIFIVLILAMNATIGSVQEFNAAKTATDLNKLILINVRVRRDGIVQQIDSSELVIGDIVILEAGSKVPADIRLIETQQLKVDESILTGESAIIEKFDSDGLSHEASITQRINMLYSGTQITVGRSIGVVVETGIATEIGTIAHAIINEKKLLPPLVARMGKFTNQISYIIVIMCVVFFGVAILKGFAWHEVFFLSIALAVSAIPEGLPIAITVALSIATKKMLAKKVLVRKLAAVEGLGSCNVIASDKTGTLTVNRQTIKKITLATGEEFDVSGQGYNGIGEITHKDYDIQQNYLQQIQHLIIAGLVANESELYQSHSGDWVYNGDDVDIAFLALGYKAQIMPHIRENILVNKVESYSSESKFSAAYCQLGGLEHFFIKGAPEVIVDKCQFMLDENSDEIAINKLQIKTLIDNLSKSAYLVIAVAGNKVENLNELGEDSLVFYGLIGMIDPLRVESIEAVKKCQTAGIKVCMVTGDHPLTAFTIAKQLQIVTSETQIISGAEFEKLYFEEPDKLAVVIKNTSVFARVSPMQKMYIVESFYKLGNFIAVTGDGVNDVPALKKANVSISMGSGSDISKDIADMIIIDDNFNSIVDGVEEGRYAYDNIRKVTYLSISIALAEIFLLLSSVIMGLPIPLTAVQLLWVNLVATGIQSVALAFEAGEPDTMKKPPRQQNESIFNRLMIEESIISGLTIGLLCYGFWYLSLQYGLVQAHARTLLFMLLVLMSNIHVLNCRSEGISIFNLPIKNNYFVIIAMISAQVIQLIVAHIPLMQKLLETDTLKLHEWFVLFGIALFLLLAMELYKLVNKLRG